jgi:hypothetical protein
MHGPKLFFCFFHVLFLWNFISKFHACCACSERLCD